MVQLDESTASTACFSSPPSGLFYRAADAVVRCGHHGFVGEGIVFGYLNTLIHDLREAQHDLATNKDHSSRTRSWSVLLNCALGPKPLAWFTDAPSEKKFMAKLPELADSFERYQRGEPVSDEEWERMEAFLRQMMTDLDAEEKRR